MEVIFVVDSFGSDVLYRDERVPPALFLYFPKGIQRTIDSIGYTVDNYRQLKHKTSTSTKANFDLYILQRIT